MVNPQERRLPVTVVTGFLGAGKTTLLRHLLRQGEARLAVVVNEFGEVGIDGDLIASCGFCPEEELDGRLVELANGCLCCTVQEEFLPTMEALLKRRHDIDCILIETSGLALPKPLVQAFRWPEIRGGATVDGVVTVVDGEALVRGELVGNLEALEAQRQADDSLDHETPIAELFEDQLACADLVLLTKVDTLSPDGCDRVQQWLRDRVAAGVQILPCHHGQVNPDLLLGFNAAVEDDLDQRPSHHDHEDDHDHDDHITSVYLELNQTFNPVDLVERLRGLVQQHSIYRIKGFVAVPAKSMRLVIQGVGQRFDHFYDRPWGADEPRQTRLVFIGEDLDGASLRLSLESQG